MATLDTENHKGIESEIGNIMQTFSKVLYEQTGLSLGIYMGPTSEEISSFFENQGMQYVTEEVLWKNLDDEEKVGKILQYLEKVSGSDRDELIIIDPYLFRTPKDNEEQNLEKILLESNFRKITAVVEKDKANKDYIKRISDKVGNKLEVLYSDEFHDRFWISNRKAGFLTGTSLNGIGKKYCNIQEIEKEDVIEIVNLLKNMQLIK